MLNNWKADRFLIIFYSRGANFFSYRVCIKKGWKIFIRLIMNSWQPFLKFFVSLIYTPDLRVKIAKRTHEDKSIKIEEICKMLRISSPTLLMMISFRRLSHSLEWKISFEIQRLYCEAVRDFYKKSRDTRQSTSTSLFPKGF